MAHTDHKENMKGKENLVQKKHGKHAWGTRKFDTSAICKYRPFMTHCTA